jgi:uncharacterized protein involved in exopolysaccharide biosynthesis
MTNRIGNGGPVVPPNGAGHGAVPTYGGGTNHLRELVNFVLRNRALVLAVPAVVVAATVVFLYLAIPVYDASAWLRIDEQRSSLPVLDALQSMSSSDQIQTELVVLRRRPLAEAVVDSLGLQLTVTGPKRLPRERLLADVQVARSAPAAEYRLVRAEGGFRVADQGTGDVLPAGAMVTLPGVRFRLQPEALEQDEIALEVLPFHEAVERFSRTVQVARPDRDADLIRIRYESRDAELVHAVPNAMARFFIRNRHDVRKTEARSTVDFLHQQIGLLSGQLLTAEDALRQFREQENIVSLVREGEVRVEPVSELRAERDVLNAERQALAQMLAEAGDRAAAVADPLAPSPYRDLIAFPTLFVNFSVSELFRSMAEVENQRAQLLNLRTPEDPDVQVLTARIRSWRRSCATSRSRTWRG